MDSAATARIVSAHAVAAASDHTRAVTSIIAKAVATPTLITVLAVCAMLSSLPPAAQHGHIEWQRESSLISRSIPGVRWGFYRA